MTGRQHFLIPFLASILLSLTLLPASAQGTNPYASYFEEAYKTHPGIPRGMLEAIAWSKTRMQHLEPEAGCQGLPTYVGVMGLVEDGKGYFKNSLEEVARLSGSPPEQIKTDPRTNILAFAAAYAQLQQSKGAKTRSMAAQGNVLGDLSEIPSGDDLLNRYARDQQFYSVLTEMKSPHTGTKSRSSASIDLEAIFGKENLAVLSSSHVKVSSRGIETPEGAGFQDRSTGTCTAENMVTDFPGAIWEAAHPRNYGSRGENKIKYVTVHTIQGSYASAISWFRNPAARVSAHYIIRASDGQITQMVCEEDKAYHVKTDNATAIGIEHEGFIEDGNAWYTKAMYESSAALTRDICRRREIDPLRVYGGPSNEGVNTLSNVCYHVKGHQHFRGNNHIDPGPYWDWDYYYRLINGEPEPVLFTDQSGELFDSGGAGGEYGDSERSTYLIQPEGASVVRIRFEFFDLEGSNEKPFDYLAIYDGTNADGNLLGRFSGQETPPDLVAQTGAVFMEFRSDCQVPKAGWKLSYNSGEAIADCEPPTGLMSTNTFALGSTLAWSDVAGATRYLLYLRKKVGGPWTLYKTPYSSITLTGLSANMRYQWLVQAICGQDSSAPAGAAIQTPSVGKADAPQTYTVRQNSGRFYDSGGQGGDYGSQERYIYRIIPPDGGRVELSFSSFKTEKDNDFLYIYDGKSSNAKELGKYSGTKGPGKVISSGNGLTLLFTSDRRTSEYGWKAEWRSIGGTQSNSQPIKPEVSDADEPIFNQPDVIEPGTDPVVSDAGNPPEQLITVPAVLLPALTFTDASPKSRALLEESYTKNFSLDFEDTDPNKQGFANRFYNLAYQKGAVYVSNPEAGFLYEDFGSGWSSRWQVAAGKWEVRQGVLMQTDQRISNANLYASLKQNDKHSYLYHWRGRLEGEAGKRRSGFHFFCSDPSLPNRGSSYFVWVRDKGGSAVVEIYKTFQGAFDRKLSKEAPLAEGAAFDCKAIYNPQKGRIELFFNNQYLGGWNDPYALKMGNGVSFRAAEGRAAFDDLVVYQSRGQSSEIQSGSAAAIPTEGPFVVRSLVIDKALNWSEGSVQSAYFGIPPTAATAPPLSMDESGSSGPLQSSYSGDFIMAAELPDAKALFMLAADFDGERWSANPHQGFLYDDFEKKSLQKIWSLGAGQWQAVGGVLRQTMTGHSNTRLSAPLAQTGTEVYLYHWRARFMGEADNARMGLHFFCSEERSENRGDSYLLYFRNYQNQRDRVEVYRAENNYLPTYARLDYLDLDPERWYDYKVVYDPLTGLITAYVDGQQVLRWKDPKPYVAGKFMSLRTANASVEIDDFKVYRMQSDDNMRITVGENAMLRYATSGSAPNARIISIGLNASGGWTQAIRRETSIRRR